MGGMNKVWARVGLGALAVVILLCLAWAAGPGADTLAQAGGAGPVATTGAPTARPSATLRAVTATNDINSAARPAAGSQNNGTTAVTASAASSTQAATGGAINTAAATSGAAAAGTQPATGTPTRPAVIPTRPPRYTAAPPKATPTAAIYVVKRGDTLAKIAASLGVEASALVSVNHLTNPSMISPGLKLIVPQGGGSTASPAPGYKHIVVDIAEQTVTAYQGDFLAFRFKVSTGRNDSTATGIFQILEKKDDAWSDRFGFWMPYWMGLSTAGPNAEAGIHALPELLDNQTLWGGEIGKPATYGGVALATDEARQLYEWADVGTLVVITK